MTRTRASSANQTSRATNRAADRGSAQRAGRTARLARDGKVPIAGFFEPPVRHALKCLAVERACSQQDLLAKALGMLFSDAVHQGSQMVPRVPIGLAPTQDPGGA